MEQTKRAVVCKRGHHFKSGKDVPECNVCHQIEAYKHKKGVSV